ncbi:beta-glucosidase [Kribbella sp. VKM Ac-2527]|uniref:Exo-alpha-(1->6)-L-arabinopyranosidase n=1 Tax=Kribbella caucasensis TaxID=2512215 RepID=A0A4R6K3Z5_9ACTN|nr:glycoside hydrolase family 3 protein [Kribbella sp. VKM Ac-2527]TDO44000.1 beta-glucosidase [Kribbella sp. VKM Ac-2527]
MSTPAPPPPFRDVTRPLGERLDDLLGRLTTEEKLALLHQHQAPVHRLGLDSFRTGTEALHGVAWLGPATVFPQALGLATTWHPELVRAVGSAVGDEVRVFHQKDPAGVGLNVWAPVVNPLRDPRWGRNEEGYSEDPWLTGVIATAYGHGLAGDDPGRLKTAPTLKHFLAYNNETDRCTTSSNLPPRVLHEYELPAFRAPIEAGAAVAVMPSYNLVNGRPAHLSPLINDAIRSWTDDELLVVSDAGAPANLVDLQRAYTDRPTAYAAALKAGVDSFTQDDNDAGPSIRHLTEALDRGLITLADIDAAAKHALAIRLRLGEFDQSQFPSPPHHPGLADPYQTLEPDLVNCPAHRDLAHEAARQSIVLLKHECHVLPLDAASIQRIAVIGPLANTLTADWYAGTLPYQVTALDGIVERLGQERVEYCEGVDRIALRIAGSASWLSIGADTVLRAEADAGEHTWFDVFDWGGSAWALRAVRTGRHLTVTEDGELVADQPGPNGWEVKQTFQLIETAAGTTLVRQLNSGLYLHVDATGTVTLADPDEATPFEIDLVIDGAARAAEAAARADSAVVVVGNHPLVNGRETEDRADLDLPAAQDRLVRAVHQANCRTVMVMSSSYPFSVDWAQRNLPALLWSAHGGQEYGRALADILFGDRDPAGRLPQTWYHSVADLPDLLDYDIIATDATYLYYRGTPLYPFGHGLSYTTFAYSDLRLDAITVPADGEVEVSFTVTNTGSRPGQEVVQLYAHQQRSRVKQPLRQLRGFQRLSLNPGESRQVAMRITAADLAGWDVTRDRPCVEAARHSVMVGRSSTDIRLATTIDVQGERIPPRTMRRLAASSFDQYCAMTLTPGSDDRGDAALSLDPGAWLAFDDVDLGSVVSKYTARIANQGTAPATVELRVDDPMHGDLLGVFRVPPTGRGTWIDAECDLVAAGGVHTLFVVFSAADLVLDGLGEAQYCQGTGGTG